MKNLIAYLLIILLLGSVFGIAIATMSRPNENAPVLDKIFTIMPGIAYADSFVDGPGTPHPPPPIP